MVAAVAALLVFAIAFGRWVLLGNQIPREEILTPHLRVLAYESFTGVSGPGPELIKEFEKTCNCRVELLSTSEAGLILEKLRLAESTLKPDVVIGLDQLTLDEARKVTKWAPVEFADVPWESVVKPYVQSEFIPVDWAPLTLIWRRGEFDPPKSPTDLLDPRLQSSMSLQDPRTSTPGMQWLSALHSWVGESQLSGYLQKLRPNIHSVSPSWANAYGLFQRRQSKMTFTYVTSLVYHWTVEKDMGYEVANFSQGHPLQVEYAGIPEACGQCKLAVDFIHFLLSAPSQRHIMTTNYMFPVRDKVSEGTPFAQLPKLPLLEEAHNKKFIASKDKLLEIWQKAME